MHHGLRDPRSCHRQAPRFDAGRARPVGGVRQGSTGGFRALKAGEVPEYTDVVDQARRDSLGRLIEHAQSLGANAVIGVRFDSSDVGGADSGLSKILAYGSAVVIRPM